MYTVELQDASYVVVRFDAEYLDDRIVNGVLFLCIHEDGGVHNRMGPLVGFHDLFVNGQPTSESECAAIVAYADDLVSPWLQTPDVKRALLERCKEAADSEMIRCQSKMKEAERVMSEAVGALRRAELAQQKVAREYAAVVREKATP